MNQKHLHSLLQYLFYLFHLHNFQYSHHLLKCLNLFKPTKYCKYFINDMNFSKIWEYQPVFNILFFLMVNLFMILISLYFKIIKNLDQLNLEKFINYYINLHSKV
jgi:hypothetical protein